MQPKQEAAKTPKPEPESNGELQPMDVDQPSEAPQAASSLAKTVKYQKPSANSTEGATIRSQPSAATTPTLHQTSEVKATAQLAPATIDASAAKPLPAGVKPEEKPV